MLLAFGRALPRRTFLRGIGVTLGLPLLDAMIPAAKPGPGPAISSVRRLGFVLVPNGASMAHWKPKGDGRDFELSPTLTPLAPFRDQLIIPMDPARTRRMRSETATASIPGPRPCG